MNFEQIVNYWPQITVLSTICFGLIGYLGKRFFDLKDKKAELKHSIFQKMKTECLMLYINITLEAQQSYLNLASEVINFSPEEIKYHKNALFEKLNTFSLKVLEARNKILIFHDKDIQQVCTDIMTNLTTLNSYLGNNLMEMHKESDSTIKDIFGLFFKEKINENTENYIKLGEIFKKEYN